MTCHYIFPFNPYSPFFSFPRLATIVNPLFSYIPYVNHYTTCIYTYLHHIIFSTLHIQARFSLFISSHTHFPLPLHPATFPLSIPRTLHALCFSTNLYHSIPLISRTHPPILLMTAMFVCFRAPCLH